MATNTTPVLYEDEFEKIVQCDEPYGNCVGTHMGCGGVVDEYWSTYKNRKFLVCRACGLRVKVWEHEREGGPSPF